MLTCVLFFFFINNKTFSSSTHRPVVAVPSLLVFSVAVFCLFLFLFVFLFLFLVFFLSLPFFLFPSFVRLHVPHVPH